jgi:predicted nuclease of predicted toxin-antitoxin system
LITNDKDFGDKIFRDQKPHKGVVLLRLDDERAAMKIDVIERLLEQYANRLENQFVVVTENTVRFAKVK